MPIRSISPNGKVTLGGDVPESLRDRPDIPYPASLITPQWRTEEALRLQLAEFGGAVEFGTALESFKQSDESVSAVVATGGEAETVTTSFPQTTVGAQGVRSRGGNPTLTRWWRRDAGGSPGMPRRTSPTRTWCQRREPDDMTATLRVEDADHYARPP
jgi:2-polyprenyl-6-methoxyphenol hydroxylase-like FAD-dependent oxidoreductase